MLFRPREKEKGNFGCFDERTPQSPAVTANLIVEPLASRRDDGGVHTPVRSKLGVYSSFALLFCCI